MFKQTTAVLAASLAAFSFQTLWAHDGEAGHTHDAPAAPEYSEAELTEMLGYMLAYNTGLKEMGFGPKDAEAIAKGLKKGLIDPQPSPDAMAKMPAFQQFMQTRAQAAQALAAAEAEKAAGGNIEAGKAYIEGLKTEDAEIQTAESGLSYKIIEPGAEAKPAMTDTVLVHYKGTLIDGTQFDSSYDRGQPATFPLNGVVPGFGEGLTKIGAGGKIVLYIPSDLGYGNSPRPGGAIKPGDTLIFECELIEVNPEQAGQ
ncbi:MAG: FKBP-type peptidyl-prolyl cis-trans isomerase [Coraliomargarita sp.]|nr:FKBP-type peptidyl-prolyl cis-trans isomerase [Coraliomargarita sp.]